MSRSITHMAESAPAPLSKPAASRSATPAKVTLALLTIYLVWGSTYLAIKMADATLPPLLMASARFLVAGALLYGWARLRGAARPTRGHWGAALVVGMLLLALGNGGVVYAEKLIPSGVAALLVAMVPLWMALQDWLRPGGRRPTAWVAVGLVFGFAGVALLIDPAQLAGGTGINLVGAGVVLVGSFCWAAGSLYARGAKQAPAPLLATGMEMLAGGAILLALGSATGEWSQFQPAAVSMQSLLGFVYLILVGSLVGFTIYVWLLRSVSTALVSTYAYVNPVVAVALGWALADEPLTTRTLLAAAVIVLGVVVISSAHLRPRGHAAATPADASAPTPESPEAA